MGALPVIGGSGALCYGAGSKVHATEVEASNEESTVGSESKEPIELEAGEGIELQPGETITAPEGTMVVLEEEQSAQEREDVWESMNAPHCLYAYKSWGAIQVQNNCPTGLRVKVVLRYAGDTGCSYIQPGTRSNVGWNPAAKIDRVVLC